MKRADLLEALQNVRDQFEVFLAELDEDQLLAPGTVGEWSVKDVLAHLTAWEVDMLTNLGKARRGQPPLPTPSAQVDAQNAKFYAAMKDRPLERVLADFDGARQQTVRVVEELGDRELEARPRWLSTPLAEYIAGDSYQHEAEHLEELRAWQTRQAPTGSNGHRGAS